MRPLQATMFSVALPGAVGLFVAAVMQGLGKRAAIHMGAVVAFDQQRHPAGGFQVLGEVHRLIDACTFLE